MEGIKKKIWLVNYYAMPPQYESRLRTIKFAQYLTQMGYDVQIFSSSFLHNLNKYLIVDNRKYIEEKYDDLKFVHIKTIGYRKSGIFRIISLFQFHVKLFFLRNEFLRPDIIIHTALPPFGNILFFMARKLKAKYIVEVLDLWPESFIDLGLIRKRNPLVWFFYYAEKWLYKQADSIVFSMEGGKDYLVDKAWDTNNGGPIDLRKAHYINNGVDLNDFAHNKALFKLKDPDLDNDEIKKIIYIGSIRLANNLRELINAAANLQDYPEIKFLLFGDGDDREPLELYCKKNKLLNIIFKQKWIDPKYVPYVLSKSNVNILNYNSASNFGKYGGSQSKLFLYLASGKPICSNLEMAYCLIKENNLGIAKKFKSSEEYASAILFLANLDSENSAKMELRAQEVAKHFDYESLTKRIIKILEMSN